MAVSATQVPVVAILEVTQISALALSKRIQNAASVYTNALL
jgi:hypothetical protein